MHHQYIYILIYNSVTNFNCLNFHEYRPLSVNSQSGGQNKKTVLHLKGLFLSGDRTTIALFSRLGITEMGLIDGYRN